MKKVKLFEDFANIVNEKKFTVGDTWEWHGKDWDPKKKDNVNVIKKVKITNVKGSEITGQFDGESKEYIIRDADKYLKKKVNESEEFVETNEGIVSIKGGRIIAHKVLNKLVDMDLIPIKKKTDDLLEVIAKVITDAKMESVEIDENADLNEAIKVTVSLRYARDARELFDDMFKKFGSMDATDVFSFKDKDAAHDFVQGLVKHLHVPVGEIDAPKELLK